MSPSVVLQERPTKVMQKATSEWKVVQKNTRDQSTGFVITTTFGVLIAAFVIVSDLTAIAFRGITRLVADIARWFVELVFIGLPTSLMRTLLRGIAELINAVQAFILDIVDRGRWIVIPRVFELIALLSYSVVLVLFSAVYACLRIASNLF